jgi:hypothetical protein
MGVYFRGQTEHVLFAVRGSLGTRRRDIPTIFEAPLGRHSEKPEKLYEIVRAASYPPYGEAFQRKPRPDFTNLFAPPPYDGERDFAESIDECYAEVRERVARGGKGWSPP